MRTFKVLWLAFLLFSTALWGEKRGEKEMKKEAFQYWFWWPAFTFDTYRADMADVMQVAKNIYAPLVSTFMDSKPEGMIAEDWRVDETGKIWRFNIRKGLYFEDGTAITPEVVLKNFKRILWLTRRENLILNSLMPEISQWKSLQDPLESLYLEGDTLVFKFNRRPTNLFETISQPVYGIANPKCFDEEGNWREPFCSSASGQYQVKSREEGKIVLKSRHIYPAAENAPDTVEILTPVEGQVNSLQALLSGNGDLAIEPRFALSRATVEEIQKNGLKMTEEPPVRMYFAQLNHRKTPFNDKSIRQSFRDIFLNSLKNNSEFISEIKLDASFIPKGGIGYWPFEIPERKIVKQYPEQTVDVLFFPLAAYPFPRDQRIQEILEKTTLETIGKLGFKARVTKYEKRGEAFKRLRAGDFDVILRFTGILVQDPYADLRLMFMSQVGALIPDPSGSIPAMIEKAESKEDPLEKQRLVEKINKTMFDDAAVVTYAHTSRVYIHRPNVDLSRFNLFADPIEFRAIKWNP